MNQGSRVNPADHTTSKAWRAANALGWPMLSLGLSLFLRLGFESAADLYGHSLASVFDWPSYGEYALLVLVPSSIVCGLLIGSIVGARVFWKPRIVSGVVAGSYAIVAWFIMRSEPIPHPTSAHWISAALLSLTVLVAAVVALRVSAARPTAPRLIEEDRKAGS